MGGSVREIRTDYWCMHVVMSCPHVPCRLPQCTAQSPLHCFLSPGSQSRAVRPWSNVLWAAAAAGEAQGRGKLLGWAELGPVLRGILGVVETELEKCWGQTEAALFLRTMDKTAH